MRAPRYRFPDEVRSTTRSMASQMVRDGTVARTPEQLDTWISQRPEVREPLVRGGYGEAFTSHDLFPLLQVFLGPAGQPAPEAEARARSTRSRLPWGIIVVVALGLLVLGGAAFVLSQR